MLYLSFCLLITAADAPPQRFHYAEPHMGTQFQITLYAKDEATANAAAKAAFARIAELDSIMSDYKPSSELMQLCRQAGGDPVAVGPDLFLVLQKGQALAKRTDGAFDVTVGPLTRLWRLSRRTQQLPTAEKLAAAKALVGHDKVELDAKNRTVKLAKSGMQLDLGGLAKGYTADQALAVLKKHGITQALVAAGGDLAAGDPPPEAAGWRVGIQPLDGKDPSRYILLKNSAVSTSGDREQFAVIDGQRYSHILDPKTGLGLRGRMSVTVVAPSGIISDSIDTAVCVLGPEKGLKLIEETPGAAALLVLDDRVIESKGFKAVSDASKKRQ